MPRYRVGTRVFDSAADAEAYRLGLEDALPVFVEPDSVSEVAERDAKEKSRANLPWLVAGGILGLEIAFRVLVVQVFLHGNAPAPGAMEILLHILEFALVWWVTSVLTSPATHSRTSVVIASALTFLTMIGLTAEIIGGIWLYRRYAAFAEATAMLRAAPARDDAPAFAATALAVAAVDAGVLQRTWVVHRCDAGGFTAAFPGDARETPGDVELQTPDGATFTVRYAALRGRTTSNTTRARLVAERDALLQRTGGVLLDDRDVPRRDGLERIVRIGVATPPTIVWARFVATAGMLYVAGVSQPASQPDTDARAFLESLTPEQSGR